MRHVPDTVLEEVIQDLRAYHDYVKHDNAVGAPRASRNARYLEYLLEGDRPDLDELAREVDVAPGVLHVDGEEIPIEDCTVEVENNLELNSDSTASENIEVYSTDPRRVVYGPDIQDLDEFVEENKDVLEKVVRHHDDNFIRGCALALLVEGGGVRGIEQIKQDIKAAEELYQLKQNLDKLADLLADHILRGDTDE